MIRIQSFWRNLFTLLMLCGVTAAWAADYVITYNGNFLGYSGSALQNYTTFNPATCIWEGTSGGKLKLKDGTGNCYLRYNNGLTNSSQTNGSNWTISDEGYMYYSSGYYIYLNGSKWAASKNNYGSTRGVAELVTTTTVADGVSVNPINGQTAINAVGSYDYTTTAKYNTAYTNYSWNSGSFDTSYTETDVINFAWTLSPATTGVQINSSTGVLSVTSLPTNTTTVTLTATATSNGRTGTATKTVKVLGTTPSAPKISNYKETVTITAEGSIDKIYYTTDGTTPTTSSTLYTGPFTVSSTPTIKAIAVRGEALSSVTSHTVINPTTGVSSDGTTVTLMDWEDIDNWTYYTGVSDDVDGGNYNNNYKGILFSPGARNIIIEYRGGSVDKASPVAISAESGENQNTMIYYQTIEKDQNNNNYPYTVIPNPFSKRPRTNNTTGTAGFYGFGGWKIIQGGDKINDYSNNDVLPLDADITFTSSLANNDKIVLEATWVSANVVIQNTKPTFTGGTYETNFWVLSGAAGGNSGTNPFNRLDQNMTISARYPDGSSSTSNASSRAISLGTSFTGTVKFEWVSIGGVAVDASGRNLFFGRGVNNGSGGALTFVNANTTVDQNVRIESGQFTTLRHYGASITTSGNHKKQHVVLGCDYDRAKGINTNLQFSSTMYLASGESITGKNSGDELARTIVKSGNFNTTGQKDIQGNPADAYYYGCSVSGYQKGYRYLEIQGGVWPTIIGGVDQTNDVDKLSFELRMKGGLVKGAIYGAAQKDGCSGTRIMVLTGGTIRGWIAGGANGTANSGAQMTGETFVYVGGNTKVVSATDANEQIPSSSLLNRAVGGNVFGAGCGYNASLSVGEVTLGTNVVVADNSTIERGVYGGGSYGFTTQTSNIYITGGHVLGKMGGVQVTGTNSTPSYSSSIHGGVYGGACQNKGGTANIFMTGGVVEGGVYGGSNASGILNGSANIKIVGGKVGLNATTLAHICGGGYGNATRVTNNVDVTIGGTATVYGEVYGGSEQGLVNTNANSDTYQSGKHVNVTVNGGTINGDVYGGGLGTSSNAANTYGETAVTVSGGEINGRVFGCNNVNGRPFDTSVTVDITGGTIHSTSEDTSMGSVYGGGNQAQYAGSPTVTLNGADATCDRIFGGGLSAQVTGRPEVNIQNGTVNKDVYGGGALANVQGNTTVNLLGGTVKDVYGAALGQKEVTASEGVEAQQAIEALVTGNATVTLNGSRVTGSIFGGNNVNGTPQGHILVHVVKTTPREGQTEDEYDVPNVYGGGNKAAYVPVKTATVDGETISNADFAEVIIDGCDDVSIENVYGGGNAAPVPQTKVWILGAKALGYVFGGGNGDGADNPGANVGYNNITNTETNPYGIGTTNVYVFGGEIVNWVFGGSNTKGLIRTKAMVDIDKSGTYAAYGGTTPVTIAGNCSLTVGEAYSSGREAPIYCDAELCLHCIDNIDAIYGGSYKANLGQRPDPTNGIAGKLADVNLTVTSGTIDKVFGGNNLGGDLYGSITVNIDETGCNPLVIGEVYGGGNKAAYTSPGVDGSHDPIVNIISCTSIGSVFGGGFGKEAVMTGNPTVNIKQIPGIYADRIDADGNGTADSNANVLGTIGNVFGGGNEAKVEGNTTINIATSATGKQKHLNATTGDPEYNVGANIIGNVYGGGNNADVTGKTEVNVGRENN